MTSTPPPQVWPSLSARDPRALIDFLVGTVGFTETVAYTDDAGTITHAELAWPAGGGVMLGQARPGNDGCVTGPGSFSAYVVVPEAADVDALAERVRAAGAEIARDVHDTDYGSHDVALRDPEGNTWHFGTYPGHALPNEPG